MNGNGYDGQYNGNTNGAGPSQQRNMHGDWRQQHSRTPLEEALAWIEASGGMAIFQARMRENACYETLAQGPTNSQEQDGIERHKSECKRWRVKRLYELVSTSDAQPPGFTGRTAERWEAALRGGQHLRFLMIASPRAHQRALQDGGNGMAPQQGPRRQMSMDSGPSASGPQLPGPFPLHAGPPPGLPRSSRAFVQNAGPRPSLPNGNSRFEGQTVPRSLPPPAAPRNDTSPTGPGPWHVERRDNQDTPRSHVADIERGSRGAVVASRGHISRALEALHPIANDWSGAIRSLEGVAAVMDAVIDDSLPPLPPGGRPPDQGGHGVIGDRRRAS